MATQAVPTNSPASYVIEEIFFAPNMMGEMQECKTGIPNPFEATPGVWTTRPEHKVIGDYGTITVTTGTRQTARRGNYGGAHKERSLRPIYQRQEKLFAALESIRVPQGVFDQLMSYTDMSRQELGMYEIKRQLKEFKTVFSNLRIAAMISALFYGRINFDEFGDLMSPTVASVPNGGAQVQMQIPNGSSGIPVPDTNVIGTNISLSNAVGLDPFATGTPIFGAPVGSWALASTHIEQQIINLKQASTQLTGYPIKHAWYGRNIPSYLMNNSYLNWYAARNSSRNDAYMETGEIPPMLDLVWHKAYDAFFIDQTQTRQQLVGDNQILLTPEIMDGNDQWVGVLEGSTVIPTDLGTISTGDSFPSGERKYGQYVYARQTDDPFGVKVFAGDVFLPAVLNPLAVFSAFVA